VRYISTKWAKFPSFVEYANEERHFLVLTPAALEWANVLAMPAVKRGGGRLLWSPEGAWEQLWGHQSRFRAFLDALIAGQPTQEHMEVLTTHCNHIVCRSSWDMQSEARRRAAAQAYSNPDPAAYEAFRETLLAKGHALRAHPPQRTRPPRYFESMTPQDPLDALYWDLREFLRRGKPERLQQCPACRRYFVQATARAQTYCDTTCRLKANPTRREKNPVYVKRHREKQIRMDLQRIRKAKNALRRATVSDILETTGIGKRRWNTLHRWEVERYGYPKVTDLTGD